MTRSKTGRHRRQIAVLARLGAAVVVAATVIATGYEFLYLRPFSASDSDVRSWGALAINIAVFILAGVIPGMVAHVISLDHRGSSRVRRVVAVAVASGVASFGFFLLLSTGMMPLSISVVIAIGALIVWIASLSIALEVWRN